MKLDELHIVILDAFLRFEKVGKMPERAGTLAATLGVAYGIDGTSFAVAGTELTEAGYVTLGRQTGMVALTDAGRIKAQECADILDSRAGPDGNMGTVGAFGPIQECQCPDCRPKPGNPLTGGPTSFVGFQSGN